MSELKLGGHHQPMTFSGVPELEHDATLALHHQLDRSQFAGIMMETAMRDPKGFAQMMQQMRMDHAANPDIPEAKLNFDRSGNLSGIDFTGDDGKTMHIGTQFPPEQNAEIRQATPYR